MPKFSIRQFRASDALEVYHILESTEELHACGLTYSEKAVRNWHFTRAQDIILIAEIEGKVVGFIHLFVRLDFPRSVNFWEKNNFKGKQNMLWMYKEI